MLLADVKRDFEVIPSALLTFREFIPYVSLSFGPIRHHYKDIEGIYGVFTRFHIRNKPLNVKLEIERYKNLPHIKLLVSFLSVIIDRSMILI